MNLPIRLRYLVLLSLFGASALLFISVMFWLPNILVYVINPLLPSAFHLQYTSFSDSDSTLTHKKNSSKWALFEHVSFAEKSLKFDSFQLIVDQVKPDKANQQIANNAIVNHDVANNSLVNKCLLLDIVQPNISFNNEQFLINIGKINFNISCLNNLNLEQSATSDAVTWEMLDRWLPPFLLNTGQLVISQTQHSSDLEASNKSAPIIAGKLSFLNSNQQQSVQLNAEHLKLVATRDKTHNVLDISSLHVIDWFDHTFSTKIRAQLNGIVSELPELIDAQTVFDSPFLPEKNNQLSVNYEAIKAKPEFFELTVSLKNQQSDLLFDGIINFNGKQLLLENAKWQWPYWEQPLSGFASIQLKNEQANATDLVNFLANLNRLDLSSHINILTKAQRGKSNLVIDLPPIKLSALTLNQDQINSPAVMPLQITGQFNYQNLSFGMSIPAQVENIISEPTLHLMPGALLRFWGALHSAFFIEEARFPLAGIYINQDGINGRLQAILKTREALWGQINLHLDGDTDNFWLHSGDWNWKAWGSGNMPFLHANWDVESLGAVNNGIVTIEQMTSGFDQIEYGWINVIKPRITLNEELIYNPINMDNSLHSSVTKPFVLLDETLPNLRNINTNLLDQSLDENGQSIKPEDSEFPLSSTLVLDAEKIEFSNGGSITKPTFDFNLFGNSLTDFQFKGDLYSKKIAAMNISGRWDGERLRGNAWWPRQSVSRLRALFSPYTDIELLTGDFYAQGSFSAAPEQGFLMGGHLVFDDVDARYNSNSFTNMDFVLPYRLENQRWQFGRNHPVTLRIEKINNLLEYKNLSVDLQGYYPFDQEYPLTFMNIGTELLGGTVKLERLTLPQTVPALIAIDNVDSSLFWQVINPKQFSMSGKLGGQLNLSLNDPDFLLKESEIYNQGDVTFRIDTDLLKSLKASNPTAASAIDWLSYLEIDKFKATFDLDNLGNLILSSQVNATNRQLSTDRTIHLSYHHRENIYLLWRSLIFKDDLHDWLEEQLQQKFVGFDVSG